jgi:hypothetical protein
LGFNDDWSDAAALDPQRWLDRGEHDLRQLAIRGAWRLNLTSGNLATWADWLMDEVAVSLHGSQDDRTDAISITLRWFRNQGLLETKDEAQSNITELSRYRPRKLVPLYQPSEPR